MTLNSTGTGELGLRGVLELARAGLRSQVLYTANALGVFTHLSRQAQSAEELVGKIPLQALALRRLLDACVALGLLQKSNGSYKNSPTAEMFLVTGKPDYVGDAVEMFRWRGASRWNNLESLLRQPRPRDMYEELLAQPERLESFMAGLRQLAVWRARALAARLDFSPFRHLLDAGAGTGVYTLEVLKRNPGLRATLFDQPPVCEIARRLVEQEDLSARVEIVAGDFFRDPLPRTDLVLFSNVLHDFPSERVEFLLQKAFAALEPGGTILISDFILEDDGSGPPEGVLMSLVLFLEADGAGNYCGQEYAEWLARAGFQEIEVVKLYETERIVRARKPK